MPRSNGFVFQLRGYDDCRVQRPKCNPASAASACWEAPESIKSRAGWRLVPGRVPQKHMLMIVYRRTVGHV